MLLDPSSDSDGWTPADNGLARCAPLGRFDEDPFDDDQRVWATLGRCALLSRFDENPFDDRTIGPADPE